jgi:hypothetical protein
MPENPGERPWWLAGLRGFEPRCVEFEPVSEAPLRNNLTLLRGRLVVADFVVVAK